MKVILAERSGFCPGVKRSVDVVVEMAKRCDGLYCYGEIAHNHQLTKKLNGMGISVIHDINDVPKGSIVVIRSHGCPPEVISELKKKKCRAIDTTCNYVKKIQNLAGEFEKKGFKIVIFGDKKHPEVEGILANTTKGTAISSIGSARRLPSFEKIAFLSKTTENKDDFDDAAREVRKHCREFRKVDTICRETELRQLSGQKLARKSDVVIVVGGFHSSNTKNLAGICSSIRKTHHIEKAADLKKDWFKGKKVVGITAGASTPPEVIEEVVQKVKLFGAGN